MKYFGVKTIEKRYIPIIEKWGQYRNEIFKNRIYILQHGKRDFVEKMYKRMTSGGGEIHLDAPNGFNEKLNANKLVDNELCVICADKDRVRGYVKNKIGEKYLIPQYFCKKRITVQDLEKLPGEFILKTSNGTNMIISDKKKENLSDVCKVMNYLTKIKYGYLWGEFYYNKVPIRIVAEKLLKDENNNVPNDIKIHCFNNGKEKHKIIEYHYKVDGQNMKNCYDENWKRIDNVYGFGSDDRIIKKPKNLKEILQVADKLSADTNYVRVDLYNVQNQIYFGELTFIPGAGYAPFKSRKDDLLWGKYVG